MTIKEFMDGLDEMDNDTRTAALREVTKLFSPPSVSTLQNFQAAFFVENPKKPPFEMFAKAQNKEIVKCLKMEMSEIGGTIRGMTGCTPISWDTVIDIKESADVK